MNVDHQPDPVENVGHERRDINVMGIVIFLSALQISMLACCLLGFAFHKGYLHWMKISAITISPMAAYIEEPPKPRLQVDPTEELHHYREAVVPIVSSYGWIDTQKGIIRLPIERAKELVAARGLPARAKS